MQLTSGARKGRDCISKLIREVSVPVTLKQLPRSTSFTPTPPLSEITAGTKKVVRCKGHGPCRSCLTGTQAAAVGGPALQQSKAVYMGHAAPASTVLRQMSLGLPAGIGIQSGARCVDPLTPASSTVFTHLSLGLPSRMVCSQASLDKVCSQVEGARSICSSWL